MFRLPPGSNAGPLTAHRTYDEVADASAALVIKRYSTSFGLASRLLEPPVRRHVRNVYALVRVADEIVDAPRPDGSTEAQEATLTELERETRRALGTGHSGNLVVHAFARTARETGIEQALLDPFFASMRADLTPVEHDRASFERYVHGSAEVVGLMCLRAFLAAEPGAGASYDELVAGARRLGAAFQKLNFLRDLGADYEALGRSYFPGVNPARLDVATRDALLDDIDADLASGARSLELLPPSSRRAVRVAHALFGELSRRVRATPPERLGLMRVRVPDPVKARLLLTSLLRPAR
ncbi:squalene/phytoene synthase family protein [Nocardioides sp. cx-169]|uniref:phytoene/squalene synthase family protein n=1 Tax=Nocardioides sp. cx-169 TaxID=2899080 RepID=UPI001E5FE322|nr:squalene/phytoene synthase family protein [Nocardioides sp. cx-169]MCD4536454.1 squalene/phytoene synthase family protein [Nocardioides sp. cx-169]